MGQTGHLFRLQSIHSAVSSVLSFILFCFDTVICTSRLDTSACIHRQNEEVEPVILKSRVRSQEDCTYRHSPCPDRDQLTRSTALATRWWGHFAVWDQRAFVYLCFKVSDWFYFRDLSVLNKYHHGGTGNPHMGPALLIDSQAGDLTVECLWLLPTSSEEWLLTDFEMHRCVADKGILKIILYIFSEVYQFGPTVLPIVKYLWCFLRLKTAMNQQVGVVMNTCNPSSQGLK